MNAKLTSLGIVAMRSAARAPFYLQARAPTSLPERLVIQHKPRRNLRRLTPLFTAYEQNLSAGKARSEL